MAVMAVIGRFFRQAPCEGPVEQIQGPEKVGSLTFQKGRMGERSVHQMFNGLKSTEGVMFYKVVLCFQKPKQLVWV